MPSPRHQVVIACAGGGKTTWLVKEALSDPGRRIAFVTYTHNNVDEIHSKFGTLNSGVPRNVDVLSWYSWLLRHCARPYQNAKWASEPLEGITFVSQQSSRYTPEHEVGEYYFATPTTIYSDKLARFVTECESRSARAVTRRLEAIYTDVFIDECQDLAGWDIDIVDMLMRSSLRVTLVGDPRQHTYTTNPSPKNKRYHGIKLLELIRKWERAGVCEVTQLSGSYRCPKDVCDFTNALWPELEEMTPLHSVETGHDGLFIVSSLLARDYVEEFKPRILRYDRRADTFGYDASNFGAVKGREFDRVLVIPTGPIKKYLKTGDRSHIEKSRDKLHVALTRARHSAAFVYDGASNLIRKVWGGRGRQ